jgi:hypothetical protein
MIAGLTFGAIGKAASRVPREVWYALAVAALAWWIHHDGVKAGRLAERATWEAAAEKAAAQAAKKKVAQGAVSRAVEEKHAAKSEAVRVVTRTIIREVPRYVPSDSCPLAGGFRVLHDAAARGVVPSPAGVTHAAPVPAQDAAATVADNYGTCHETETRLTALQDWIRQQQALDK